MLRFAVFVIALLPVSWSWPSFVACAGDTETKVRVGTTMMGVQITRASGVKITALRNGAGVTSHIQGEVLQLQISGFPAGTAGLVRSDDGANGTLDSRDGVFPLQKCASQLATKNFAKIPGTAASVYFRPGCTGKGDPIKLQFLGCTLKGKPVELTELTLTPARDTATGKVLQDPSCGGAPIPTAPPGPQVSGLYTSLVWFHRWAVLVTWCFLFPLGVALVRHYPCGTRLKMHRYVQICGLLVEIAQIACIVYAHHVGPYGDGPIQDDGPDFSGNAGSSPGPTHKQRGLAVDICVMVQLLLGFARPSPYPNGFLRRVWMWAHRLLGDGALVVAWINIWEAIATLTDQNIYLTMTLVGALLSASAVVVTPVMLMLKASSEDRPAARDLVPLARGLPEEDADGCVRHFSGCAYCDQVFAERRILEVHMRFIHPGREFREVLTPMPRRFAEAMNSPAVNAGIPLSEVSRHTRRDDCWVALNGTVYDLSSFLKKHPGGPSSILSWAGRDASRVWNMIHSPAWISEHLDTIENLGPVGPEPPVEGMTSEPTQVPNSLNRRAPCVASSAGTAALLYEA